MTGGVCLVPPSGGGLGRDLGDVRGNSGCDQYAPVNFIYRSFHDSIRSELESLLESVLALEPNSPSDSLVAALGRLRERYRFLEQVYKCHSTLEDEVRPVARKGTCGCCYQRHPPLRPLSLANFHYSSANV